MRNPERISGFLYEFQRLWEEYPDMRFGQLVVSVLGDDPFYVEDDKAFVEITKRISKDV